MTWEEEQTMSLLVPVSACQEQAQDLKLSSMIIKHWNMCFTILITCPAVAFALQSGCSSLLMRFKLAFHSPHVFLKIRACWWLSLLSRVSLQQLKGSSWFQKKTGFRRTTVSREIQELWWKPRTLVLHLWTSITLLFTLLVFVGWLVGFSFELGQVFLGWTGVWNSWICFV